MDALSETGAQVVLIAAVGDEKHAAEVLERASAAAVDTGAVTAPGRLWLVPGGDGEGAAARDGAAARLPFAADEAEPELNPRIIDEAIDAWWQQAPAKQLGDLLEVTVQAPFRSPEAFKVRAFLAGSGVVFLWEDPKAGDENVYVTVPGEKERLKNPSLAKLAVALHLVDPPKPNEWFDVIIVGGGPAGLAAAVYGGAKGLMTLVIEDTVPGGQVGTSSEVANYLGFPEGVTGFELARRALAQAKKFKVLWQPAHKAVELRLRDKEKDEPHEVVVQADKKKITYRAGAVVIATGLTPIQLTEQDVEGISKLDGRGIYYSALSVDAPETYGQPVAIVGGGNSAGQAALHLAQYAESVTMIVRGPGVKEKMADYLVKRIEKQKNIKVLPHSNVKRVTGDKDGLSHLQYAFGDILMLRDLDARWLYLLLGGRPNVGWLGKEAAGRIKTSKVSRAVLTGMHLPGLAETLKKAEEQAKKQADKKNLQGPDREKFIEGLIEKAKPASTQTSVPGVFAIGDVQHGTASRVGAAVGQGAAVTGDIFTYIAKNSKRFPSFKTS